ncbi:hypothetical protein FRC12_022174, partial [Ceratobasidium sp. 428]
MLVVQSTSSYCDICLEFFSQEYPAHVLPCGHAFCQSCTGNVQSSQGVIFHDGIDWAAAANNPLFSVNDLPRLAPCPLCRSPFARDSTYRLQATYTANTHQATSSEGTASYSEAASSSYEDSASQVEGSDEIELELTRAAMKTSFETQISDIIFEGIGSASRDEILALNHQVQEWLADEAQDGRVEE